ncbi:MAG: hypothetical protein JRF71_10995 [Deltaproteobacteria bacterium]|nr:hypothetical protein [Deltaproteobacteria bacterium]MBW2201338.1 hypothetical protein [Deltaproteobacteria bacterium]
MAKIEILFVDEEKSQRDSMLKILDKLGYTVQVAESAEAALKHLEKRH